MFSDIITPAIFDRVLSRLLFPKNTSRNKHHNYFVEYIGLFHFAIQRGGR